MVTVPDPDGIGARGYVPRGINQPYATHVANVLERQNVALDRTTPNMDSTAQRFLAHAAADLRPTLYGVNPIGRDNRVVEQIITRLKRIQ